MIQNKKRDMAFIVVFGSLWGISEITLGAYLHALTVPFVGIIMSCIAIIIFLTGILFTEFRLSLFYMGIIAAFLKLFSLGGFILTPFIAIILESLIGQLVILLFSRTRFSFILAGGIVVTYTFGHRILNQIVLYGRGITQVYIESIQLMTQSLGIQITYSLFALIGVVVFHFIVGGIAGTIAWYIGNKAKFELGY